MTSFLRRFAVLAVFAAVLAVLPACDRSPDEPGLPTGPQILTGTLLPTEISLSRRGTHLFRLQNSLDAYYAESAEVNLRSR